MGEKTKIQWCDYTFNPWRGCAKVSAGCDHCYAREMAKRNSHIFGTWGPAGERVVASDAYWKQPLRWNRAALAAGLKGDDRPRVFCGSLCDVFEDRPELLSWRDELFDLIGATRNLQWMLLTKRPENALRLAPAALYTGSGLVRDNLWLGTTIENQDVAADRLLYLLRVPASRRFLSLEPLLGPIKLVDAIHAAMDGLDWSGTRAQTVPEARDFIHEVIIGGESGPHARPCHLDWITDLLRQCDEMGIPAFVKQLGSRTVGYFPSCPFRHPKGGDPAEWPAWLGERAYGPKAR